MFGGCVFVWRLCLFFFWSGFLRGMVASFRILAFDWRCFGVSLVVLVTYLLMRIFALSFSPV